MTQSHPFLRYVIAGKLQREFIITPNGEVYIDSPGGNLLYAASGLRIWDHAIGLIGRVGEDYPQEWLVQITNHGFDRRGIITLPQMLDLRSFIVYHNNKVLRDNPVSHFTRLGIQLPKNLLGYSTPDTIQRDSAQNISHIIHLKDIPEDYLDTTVAHLCPLDFQSHNRLVPYFKQGHVNTISLDPSIDYMKPTNWEFIPSLLSGVTIFLVSEEKIKSLFKGRSNDLWEMAEAIASFGCEIIVIKRGSEGQYVYSHSDKKRWMIPAYPVRIKDPTGAGDAFCGGFIAGFRKTYDPLEAALFGNISAAITMEGNNPFYLLDILPGLAKARLNRLRELAQIL
ncbi:MAG: carbohydrate kinase family protein [Anaerolineaceae bacterium]|nr:carbohydrate kinase family protein [Anaerolineaceae bacterium]